MINASLNSKMKSWRHALHQIPEFGFETFDTAAFIVKKLNEFGIEDIQTGIGSTGIVATIRCGGSNKAIALRADMDALMIEEQNHGRIILFNKKGEKEWEFINKDSNQDIGLVSWSRIIEDKSSIEKFKLLVENKEC